MCYDRHLQYFADGKKLPFTKEEFDKVFKAKDFWKLAFDCGSWLEFRWYMQSDITKLHTANFCKRDKMCPACTVRRAYKQQQKFIKILEAEQSLKDTDWYYIVIPVKHHKTESFETVYNRLDGVLKKILKSMRNSKQGKGNNFFSLFTGGMYSIEATHTENGWNVHLNLIINAPKGTLIALKDIRNRKGQVSHQNEGLRLFLVRSADSQMHNIQKIDSSTDEKMREALVEVLKYSLKFSSLTSQQLLEVYIKTYRKRLFGTFGNLRGVGIEDIDLEGDTLVDPEYLELIFTRCDFEYTLYKREIKQIEKEVKK